MMPCVLKTTLDWCIYLQFSEMLLNPHGSVSIASVIWNILPWQGRTGEQDSASDPLLPFNPQTYFWALGVKTSHSFSPSIPKCQSNARETQREPLSSSASCQNSLRISRAFNQCKRSQHVHGTKVPVH